MTRKQKAAPEGITLIKTSRGSWIAIEEIWDGDTLTELRPMRAAHAAGILQARERREILLEVERAILNTKLREAERTIRTLKSSARDTARDTARNAAPKPPTVPQVPQVPPDAPLHRYADTG